MVAVSCRPRCCNLQGAPTGSVVGRQHVVIHKGQRLLDSRGDAVDSYSQGEAEHWERARQSKVI